eukprot:6180887-Pleurochrysis_carterae.AAC.2
MLMDRGVRADAESRSRGEGAQSVHRPHSSLRVCMYRGTRAGRCAQRRRDWHELGLWRRRLQPDR